MQGWRSIWAVFIKLAAKSRPRRGFSAIPISTYHALRIFNQTTVEWLITGLVPEWQHSAYKTGKPIR
jgi:hypothetical protein